MVRKINNVSSFYRGILYGWILGNAIGLMIAPNSGEDMRGIVLEKSERLKDRAFETFLSARQQAEDLARRSTNQASSINEQGRNLIRQQKIYLQSVIVGIREGVRAYNRSYAEGFKTSLQPTSGNTNLEA